MRKNRAAFREAKALMPGGVSSPARACKSVGSDPVFAHHGEGAYLHDLEGKSYRDYVCAFGPLVLGHSHPEVVAAVIDQAKRGLVFGTPTEGETELARRIITHVPSVERLRLVSSGTEATMSAIRLARGVTRREKIVKFAGCYHGHVDHLLVRAGSGAMTHGAPDSAGVTRGAADDTLVAIYNDIDSVLELFATYPDQIAAVIVEPVAGNMGVVPPVPGFLDGLREVTSAHSALLVFDEVMTGFRLHLGGAQTLYDVHPDLTCLGKIIGGGMPLAAYGGPATLMSAVAPEGPVYQAGTNSGNPVCVAAGNKTLEILERGGVIEHIDAMGARLGAGLREAIENSEVGGSVNQVGSMITLFFSPGPVRSFGDIRSDATKRFARFWRGMREGGVLVPPSQYEAWFVSAAHDEAMIDYTIKLAKDVLGQF